MPKKFTIAREKRTFSEEAQKKLEEVELLEFLRNWSYEI